MSDTGGKKKRKSRKSKEEKQLKKDAKEQEQGQEQEQEQAPRQMPFTATPEQQQTMLRPDINEKMMNMDVRIKYGFIKTLHNNLISINSRFNWSPEELMSIGMIFRDLQSIELNVLETVLQVEEEENSIEEEEEEEEEEEVVEAVN